MAEPVSTHKVAAVTGGLGGIGGGIVVALTRRGFDVVVCDRSIDPAAAESLEARAAPDTRLSFVSGDLANLEDHHHFVNARGAFFLTQAVYRRMLAAGGEFPESARSVVFISSSNAAIAAPERGEYAMSKAAVAMMAKLYAIRLAPHGIAVYEVRPGLFRTPMTGVAQARFDKLLEDGFTPINRWGTPEDVGRAVATMAAGDLPFTTGAAIQVDGGMHIHHY
jgi:3-oxoacyl-[acyl-carrier protein] reductase